MCIRFHLNFVRVCRALLFNVHFRLLGLICKHLLRSICLRRRHLLLVHDFVRVAVDELEGAPHLIRRPRFKSIVSINAFVKFLLIAACQIWKD